MKICGTLATTCTGTMALFTDDASLQSMYTGNIKKWMWECITHPDQTRKVSRTINLQSHQYHTAQIWITNMGRRTVTISIELKVEDNLWNVQTYRITFEWKAFWKINFVRTSLDRVKRSRHGGGMKWPEWNIITVWLQFLDFFNIALKQCILQS